MILTIFLPFYLQDVSNFTFLYSVNLTSPTSVVRIHLLPPLLLKFERVYAFKLFILYKTPATVQSNFLVFRILEKQYILCYNFIEILKLGVLWKTK